MEINFASIRYVYFYKNKNLIMLISCVPTYLTKMGDNKETSSNSVKKEENPIFSDYFILIYENFQLCAFSTMGIFFLGEIHK